MLSQVIEDGEITSSYFTADPLTLITKNTDALILGGSTKEGGDIKVYRDASGNLQMSVDTDAASNTKALDIYGGVVAQNNLTIGQTSLNTSFSFYVNGNASFDGICFSNTGFVAPAFRSSINRLSLDFDIPITSPDAQNHALCLQIGTNDIICVQATGDGAGGIVNKAIGLYGTTPVTQAGVISDPAESTAANNAAIDSILAALRGIGLIAT